MKNWKFSPYWSRSRLSVIVRKPIFSVFESETLSPESNVTVTM